MALRDESERYPSADVLDCVPDRVDARTLGEVLGINERNVQLRAAAESWPYEERTCRGGRQRLYRLDGLPQGVQLALVQRLRPAAQQAERAPAPVVSLAEVRTVDRARAVERAVVVDAYRAWMQTYRDRYPSARVAQEAFCAEWSVGHPERPVSRATLLRWHAAEVQAGTAGLVPGYSRRGNPAEWPDEAKRYLRALWLNENQPAMQWAIERLRWRAAKEEWRLPSDRTLRRFLDGTPTAVKVRLREGLKAWVQKCLPHVERSYDGLLPNDIWVPDHTPLDLWVRDEDGKVFRPWLTAYEDVASRRVVGWALAETPSSDTIVVAFVRGARRCGAPLAAYQDNGRDFSSRRMSGGIAGRFRLTEFQRTKTDEEMHGLYKLLEVETHFAIPGNGRAKLVERFFRTLEEDLVKSVRKGYAGRSPEHRPEGTEAERRRGDVLSLKEFEGLLERWIADVYERRPHTGEGMRGRTPAQAWNDGLEAGAVVRMASPAVLALLLGQARQVQVTRQGVRVEKQSFWSRKLVEATDLGQSVVVRFDPADLSAVQVFDLEGRHLAEAAAVGLTDYFDEDAPHQAKARAKVVRETHEEMLAEVAAVRRGIAQEDLSLGVVTDETRPAAPTVVAPLRTAMDTDARGLVGRSQERKRERAERAQAAAEAARLVVATAPKAEPVPDAMAALVRVMRGAG